jgi:hypothetical protein
VRLAGRRRRIEAIASAVAAAIPSGDATIVMSRRTPPISAIVTGPRPTIALSASCPIPEGCSVLPNSAPRTLPAPPTTLYASALMSPSTEKFEKSAVGAL